MMSSLAAHLNTNTASKNAQIQYVHTPTLCVVKDPRTCFLSCSYCIRGSFLTIQVVAARSVRCVKAAVGIVVILDHALTLVRVLSCSLPTHSHFGSRQAPQNTAPHCWLLCFNKQRGYTTRFAGGAMVHSCSETLHVAAASHAFSVGAAWRSVSEWPCVVRSSRLYHSHDMAITSTCQHAHGGRLKPLHCF